MNMNAQTQPLRPPVPVVTCNRCSGFFVDDHDGRAAHRVVFGHTPERNEGTK